MHSVHSGFKGTKTQLLILNRCVNFGRNMQIIMFMESRLKPLHILKTSLTLAFTDAFSFCTVPRNLVKHFKIYARCIHFIYFPPYDSCLGHKIDERLTFNIFLLKINLFISKFIVVKVRSEAKIIFPN